MADYVADMCKTLMAMTTSGRFRMVNYFLSLAVAQIQAERVERDGTASA